MLVRATRLLSLAWLVSMAAMLAIVATIGWTTARAVVFGALLLAHPTLLGVEMLIARCVSAGTAAPRPRFLDVARALAGEWLESAAIFGWRMPWRSHAVEDHLPTTSRGLRGVVFVHGYFCNRGLWNPWMRRLRRLDRACVAVSLEPVFARLDDYVPEVERAVRRVEAATGLAPLIVAHSMGGLVARAWLRARATPGRGEGLVGARPSEGARHRSSQDGARPIGEAAHLITIGTPHRGTWMARLGSTPNALDMRPGGAWLTALAASEPETLAGLITSWWSDCDQVVYPPPNAVYPGSEARQLRGVGHIALTAREEIWNEIRRRIDD